MLLGLLVIIDANKKQLPCIFCYFRWIFLPPEFTHCHISGLVELQFYDECGLADITARNHHKVSIALARSILEMDDVIVARPNVSHGQNAGEGVLIIIGEDARVFIVRYIDSF